MARTLLFAAALATATAFSAARRPRLLPRSRALPLRGGALADHSGAVSSLFGNMRAPAALIAGSIVPLGFLGAPSVESGDSRVTKALKKAYLIIALVSLCGEITAIIYSTVAINKLAETTSAPTSSVVELLQRDCELKWLGSNVGFLGGLFGFLMLLGLKTWFAHGDRLGRVGACVAAAALTHSCSIVNKGIAQGDGEEWRLAANFFGLTARYLSLLFADAFRTRGPLQLASLLFAAGSVFFAAKMFRGPPPQDAMEYGC